MAEEILRLENVGFEAGGQQILKKIHLTVEKGKIVTVTGPSGGGKSTLLKMMGMLISPTSGTIYYKGQDMLDYEPTEYRKEVSYFFQNAVLFDDTVRENLEIGRAHV